MGNLSHLSNIMNFDPTPPSIDQQVREAMSAVGVQAPDALHFDGTIHRYATSDKHGDSAGWYILFGDNIPSGTFGDWRTGVSHNFRALSDRVLTAADEILIAQRIAEARKSREAETIRRQAMAADTVSRIWDSAGPVGADHPYLKRKGIQAHMARMGLDGRLILPLFNEDGELSSLQYIDHEGNKLYHAGGKVSACYVQFGDPSNGHKIYVAEGFATAATIAEIMQTPTIAAYSASNLVTVVEIMRRKYPMHQIIIVADNDESGTGKNYADQAAAKYGAQMILIPNKGQDANDYQLSGGDLQSLLNPSRSEWFISDAELVMQPAPIKWLVRHWLQAESVIVVHGPSTVGKSFQVVDWGLCIAYKNEWNGEKIYRGTVAYCAGEGHHGLRGRIAAWRQANGVTETGRFFLSKTAKPLDTAEGLQSIIAEIRSLPETPSLVIIDTLSKFMIELDENSNKDINFLIKQAETIMREFNTSVLIVHHTGHGIDNQSRGRGGSALRAGVENEISVRFDGNNRLIEQIKMKEMDKLPVIYFNLKSVNIEGWFDEEGEQVTSAVIEYMSEPQKEDKYSKKDMDTIEKMWNFSGKDVVNESPYLTYAAMKRYYIEVEGRSESSAKMQLVKSGDRPSFLKRIIESGMMSEYKDGYMVCDDDLRDLLFIRRAR